MTNYTIIDRIRWGVWYPLWWLLQKRDEAIRKARIGRIVDTWERDRSRRHHPAGKGLYAAA